MIGYCPAVYLICYFLLYVRVSNTTLFRQRLKWIQSWVNEADSFNEASEVRTDYLQHFLWYDISYTF